MADRAVDREASRTPRNHRGGRSLISLAASLPDWARRILVEHRFETSPRLLRLVLRALRTLVVLLETRLEELEANEASIAENVSGVVGHSA